MEVNIKKILTYLLLLCVEGFVLTWLWNQLIPVTGWFALTFGQGTVMLFMLRLAMRRPVYSDTMLANGEDALADSNFQINLLKQTNAELAQMNKTMGILLQIESLKATGQLEALMKAHKEDKSE